MSAPKVYTGTELGLRVSNAAQAFALYIAGQPWGDEVEAKREKRDVIPLVNIYDADQLLHLGYGHGDGGIETLALKAQAEGHKGIVEYGFAIDKDLGPNVESFNEYNKLAGTLETPACYIVAGIHERHATGQLTLGMGLSAATGVVLKRWRDELASWKEKRAFTVQRQRHVVNNYDVRELAEKMFLAGDFYPFAAVLMDARPLFIDLWKRYPPTIRLARGRANSVRDGEAVNSKGRSVPAKIATHTGFVAYSTNASSEMRKDLGIKR